MFINETVLPFDLLGFDLIDGPWIDTTCNTAVVVLLCQSDCFEWNVINYIN